jgi:hypothetical protein
MSGSARKRTSDEVAQTALCLAADPSSYLSGAKTTVCGAMMT